MKAEWSEWRRFPDPRKLELLTAPFGPGCYELRDDEQLLVFGMGGHVAYRMSSLLPAPKGCGTRNNVGKGEWILEHLGSIQSRTLACATVEEAKEGSRDHVGTCSRGHLDFHYCLVQLIRLRTEEMQAGQSDLYAWRIARSCSSKSCAVNSMVMSSFLLTFLIGHGWRAVASHHHSPGSYA